MASYFFFFKFRGGIKRKPEIYNCETCGIELNSLEMWNSHLKGQKHAKKVRQIAVCHSFLCLDSHKTEIITL